MLIQSEVATRLTGFHRRQGKRERESGIERRREITRRARERRTKEEAGEGGGGGGSIDRKT